MRKISSLVTLLIIAITSIVTFTSCDYDPFYDDWHRGYYHDDWGNRGDQTVTAVLDGCWRGNTHWYNSWSGHNYTTSEVEFIPKTSTYGTGYWVDYYDSWDSGYYIFNDIEWQVRNGEIQVHFIQENSYVYIYDYDLNDRYFDGYIDDNGNDVKFQLDRISYPYYKDWSYYNVTSYAKSSVESRSGASDKSGITFKRGNWDK